MDVRSKSGHTEECKADKRHKISQYLEKCDREHLYLRPESVSSTNFGSCTDVRVSADFLPLSAD